MKRALLIIAFIFAIALTASAQSNPPLTITEADGTPSKTNATKLVFQSGTLSIVGGVITYTAPVAAGTVTTAGGTPNSLPVWLTSTTLGDSPASADGTNFTIDVSGTVGNIVLLSNGLNGAIDRSPITIRDTAHGNTIENGQVILGAYGGTGVTNAGKTITLGGNLVTSGAFATTITSTATTNSTLPAGTHNLAPLDSPTFITGLSSPAITDSGLTAGRVTFAGTGGLLSDDADMSFSTDTLTVTKLVTNSVNGNAFTAGSYTLTGTAAKTLNFTDNVTLSSDGTGTRTLNIGAGGTLATGAFAADALNVHLAGTETITGAKTFSTQIVAPAGSAGNPSYAFTGNTTTGMYSPLASTIFFSLGGSAVAGFPGSRFSMISSYRLAWSSSSDPNAGDDVNISRSAAGIAQFGTTSANALGSWLATNGTLSGSLDVPTLTSLSSITGGASNMTITSGTGNSRTMILRTTTSGGTATTFLTGNADQSTTFAGQVLATAGATATPGLSFSAAPTVGFREAAAGVIFTTSSADIWYSSASVISMRNNGSFAFSSTTDPTATADTALERNAAGILAVTNGGGSANLRDLKLRALTMGAAGLLSISSGTNQRAGNLTLVGGTSTVSNTTVTANSIVILTRKTSGGTIGTAITYTLSAGTSFTVNSDNILDTSTFSYVIIEVP